MCINVYCRMSDVKGLRSEANMLAGINPNLVHVDGGAELSIYGDFPGDDLWRPGSET